MDGALSQERHEAAVHWFSQHQLAYILQTGIIPEWFHGIITRKAAEDLLNPKPPGYFLIRVSESRIGYTLSYRAQDRCRHFMIDVVLPDNHFMIVGEDKVHRSLQDLVAFHRRIPILPFNEFLTVACGQVSKDKVDYAELIFPKTRHPTNVPSVVPTSPPLQDNNVSPAVTEEIPPALPYRSAKVDNEVLDHTTNASPVPAGCVSPCLYPCLEAELGALTVQDVIPTPAPLPRKILLFNSAQVDHRTPELPARNSIDHRKEQLCSRTNGQQEPKAGCNGKPMTHPGPNQPNPKTQEAKSGINLTHLKKKFQKMRIGPEDHTYAEISDVNGERQHFPGLGDKDGGPKVSENEYEELPEPSDKRSASKPSNPSDSGIISNSEQPLPSEYLPPPPFAPGY
ncbi:hypothetical protein ACEWY4_014498 [Coilia grayii]|uniref:SH2 domain-containing protein n=1 Tax=Coilia grayii TaxID=363190 RepID=A0ABD1JSN0_9TELE